jgi:hypothetical protein
MKTGIELIADERQRQTNKEGWTAEHDAQFQKGELANAAIAYLIATKDDREAYEKGWIAHTRSTAYWPWDRNFWKPKDRLANLVRAGALIAAEIDRFQQSVTHERGELK